MLECQNYEFKDDENVEFDVQADERGRPHATALKPVVGRKPSDCFSFLKSQHFFFARLCVFVNYCYFSPWGSFRMRVVHLKWQNVN